MHQERVAGAAQPVGEHRGGASGAGVAIRFFQLINARYERGAMILTSNRGFGECAEIFGDAVVASPPLDRLLHHAIVIAIEGNSYGLREHAEFVPDPLRNAGRYLTPPQPLPAAPIKQQRGRPPKSVAAGAVTVAVKPRFATP
jgi:hypothetical protein